MQIQNLNLAPATLTDQCFLKYPKTQQGRISKVITKYPRVAMAVGGALFASAAAYFYYLYQNVIEIVHLGQLHWVEELAENPEAIEQIWESQCKIANYLLENPEAEIFNEGLSEDIECPPRSPRPLEAAYCSKLFPNGIPVGEWSWDQKNFFAEYGASQTLCWLGKIKRLHRSASPEEQATLDHDMQEVWADHKNRWVEMYFLKYRSERNIINQIKTFLSNNKNKSRKLVIVYGSKHDFSRFFETYFFSSYLQRTKFTKIDYAPFSSWEG